MKQIVFVTSSDDKAREASIALGYEVKRVKLELDELQSMDLRVIVEHKTRQAFAKLKKPVMTEDVSFEIKQWGGFPGPFIKFLSTTMGYEKLCAALRVGNRVADWTVGYGYFDGKKFLYAEATMTGSIAQRPRGGGWGFDVVYIPKGQTKTIGELGPERKQPFSARTKALRKMKDLLVMKTRRNFLLNKALTGSGL
jgi:non-canonical purine NTP pyrophosphatase (RdgB/HAM1 family)